LKADPVGKCTIPGDSQDGENSSVNPYKIVLPSGSFVADIIFHYLLAAFSDSVPGIAFIK